MHPKAVVVLLLVLALCRCCVGGPKPNKGKGTSSSTGSASFNPQLAKTYKQMEKNKQQQQQPGNNKNLPIDGNGYSCLPGLESATVRFASGKTRKAIKVEQKDSSGTCTWCWKMFDVKE
uniref:Secreted protein n=1 Tax=Globodera pallida TaxID=36090 RepID=A0A183BNA7_GLOPA